MARPLSRLIAARAFSTTARGPSTAMSAMQKAFANRSFESHEELYKFSIEKVNCCEGTQKSQHITEYLIQLESRDQTGHILSNLPMTFCELM